MNVYKISTNLTESETYKIYNTFSKEDKKKISDFIDKYLNQIDGQDKMKILNVFEYGSRLLEDQKKEIYSLFDSTILLRRRRGIG